MPLRDDRRGRRATIFANGVVFSPRFESTGEAHDLADGQRCAGPSISRWWQHIVSRLSLRAVSTNADTSSAFAELVVAEMGRRDAEDSAPSESSGQTCVEPKPVDRELCDPQSPRRFEVDVDAFDRRERIIPITRRRLQPRPIVPAERGQIDLLRGLLETGDDAERAAAIDESAHRGLRAELIFALEDRLEPLAAKAALALAGSAKRNQLIRAIEPHVSEGRLAAILSFLPGLE